MLFEVSQDHSPETPSGANAPVWSVGIMVRHLLDNLEQAAIAAAHIGHSGDIVETLQA